MTELDKKYAGFSNEQGTFTARSVFPEITKTLAPGVYTTKISMRGTHFIQRKINNDKIVDLPSPEYDQLLNEIKTFIDPETKALFDKFGFLYKRSSLIGGPPGTGKTVLINRIAEEVVAKDGIVLIDPDPYNCEELLGILDDTQPDTLKLVIFEEFDQYFARGDNGEGILQLLDSGVQSKNVMFFATTNFIERIPQRVKRPGRFSSIVDMKMPNKEARTAFLTHKLGESEDISTWVEKSDGLSVDELKETVLAVKCLGQNLDVVLKRVKEIRGSESDAS